MWDLLGRVDARPTWELLGSSASYPKTPYASILFGQTPAETLARVNDVVRDGYSAVKLGWSGFGACLASDSDQLAAAREALGPDRTLLVDAGQAWGGNLEAALDRVRMLESWGVAWLEEPFEPGESDNYARLAAARTSMKLAGGEASHNARMALNLIDLGRVGYVQVDCGRIGGLGPAYAVAGHAQRAGVQYVNHTFTSHLALSASLQPFAGLHSHDLCEFPTALSPLAKSVTRAPLPMDANGQITAPVKPGLGVEVDTEAITPYVRNYVVQVDGKTLAQG